MEDVEKCYAIAIGLMEQALVYLDHANETHAAAHLSQALDATLTVRPLKPGERLAPELAALIAGIPLNG